MSVNNVRATINGQTYNLSYNSSSGKWEAAITAPSNTSWNQSNHKYGITITAADQAGNTTVKDRTDESLGSSLQLRVLEKVKPTISLSSPSSGARITNSKPSIQFNLRDNGSGIKISSLALKIDGQAAVNNTTSGMTCTSVTGGYNCTYVPSSALNEGSHTITISVQDNDGNVSNQLSSSFSVDTAPPILNVTNPGEGLITKNTTITINGTTNDASSSPVAITIKLNETDQGDINVSSGSFTKTITLAEGANTIEIKATDAAGLISTVARHITLDTKAPVIKNVTVTPNPVDGGQTFNITVTAED